MSVALLVDADQWDPKCVHSLVRSAEATQDVRTREAFGAFDGQGAQAPWRGLYARSGFAIFARTGRDAADDALVERARELAGVQEIWAATRDRELLARLAEIVGERTRLVVPVPTPPKASLRPIAIEPEPPGDDLQREVFDAIARFGTENGELLLSVLAPLVKVDPRLYGYLRLQDALRAMPPIVLSGGQRGGAVTVALRQPPL